MNPAATTLLARTPGFRSTRLMVLAALMALVVPSIASAETAFLGISSRSVSGEDARRLDLPTRDGALIEKVYGGTAAEAAGLKKRDIILEFGGEKVYDDGDLTQLIRSHDPEDAVEMVVQRGGKRMTLTATLGSYRDYEDNDDEGQGGWVGALENLFGGGRSNHPTLGVNVMELNAQLAEYFEVEEVRGVLITQVVRRSSAEAAGIRAGDVVVRVAGSKIYGTGDISDALEERFGETVKVSLIRKGKPMEVQVQLEDD